MGGAVILGMGNPFLTDDAVGVRLAHHLRHRLGERPGLTWVEECSVGGLNLLDLLAGHDRAVVLDSIRAGGPPGGWYRLDARSLHRTINLTGVHDANLATALELGRRVGMALPADEAIHLFAVEVEENRTFSERMSPPLEARFPELASEISAEVESLLAS